MRTACRVARRFALGMGEGDSFAALEMTGGSGGNDGKKAYISGKMI